LSGAASEDAPVNRKLAAVMAIDVVGYSSLIAEDEEGTLARLQESRRDLINPVVAGHRGRIVKLVGDGALVEFPSVVEAVQAAVEIQRAMAERMADEPVEHRLALRIGINLGDVIVEGDDIYGDGVNIAARLEQLASAGGICVARNVHSQVKDKLALAFTPLGAQHVKNIPQPIIAYRLDPLAGAAVQRRARMPNRREIAVLVAALLLISGGGWWAWTRHGSTSPAVATVAAPSVLPLSDKPSIAVLPFDNLSGDARWGRLVGGLVEDVITDLARHPEIFVIARNSSSAYGGKAVDVSQVGCDLGVRYVLEGSIQADGDRIRVTTQLIDTGSKVHVWAQRYDRPATDLFAVQDDITAHVANALGNWSGQLARAQRDMAKHKPPANLDAYDLYLLGVEQKHLFTKESETEAIRLLKEAVKLDPGFARAWATLALAYSIAGQFGFMDGDEAGRQWRDATLHALRLEPNDPIALTQRACIRAMDGDLAGAKDDFDRALAIAPNDADVWRWSPTMRRSSSGRRIKWSNFCTGHCA
jgi:TolB-like protein/class 3 adenylate cyclase